MESGRIKPEQFIEGINEIQRNTGNKNTIQGELFEVNTDKTYNVKVTDDRGVEIVLFNRKSATDISFVVNDTLDTASSLSLQVNMDCPNGDLDRSVITGFSGYNLPKEPTVRHFTTSVAPFVYVVSTSPYLTGPILKLNKTTGEYLGSFGEVECDTVTDIMIINNYIYILDRGNECVFVYDSNGIIQSSMGFATTGHYNLKFAKDSSNNIYITDGGDYKIYKYSLSGTPLLNWGGFGNTDGKFKDPRGIGVNSNNKIYVVSADGLPYHRVQVFNTSGNFVKKFGTYGTGNGEFHDPQDICFDPSGNFYICELGNDRVQKFNSNEEFVLKWGSYGTGDGQFRNPSGINYYSGEIYVADYGTDRIQVFNTSGIFQRELTPDELYDPYAVTGN